MALPKPITRHQIQHKKGHYFAMRYDSGANTHAEVRNTMRLDPRVVRSAHVKLADGKLETLAKFGGPKWQTNENTGA
jgi:ribosomal protein S6